jgi:SAM-dependent methyltransferase
MTGTAGRDEPPDPHLTTLASYQANVDRYLATLAPHPAPATVRHLTGFAELLPAGALVLEVGSGPGRDADELEARGLRVRRTDATAAFVERLRRQGHPAELLDLWTEGDSERAAQERPKATASEHRRRVSAEERSKRGVEQGIQRPGAEQVRSRALGVDELGGPYAGIWAAAVLLHLSRPRLAGVLRRFRAAVPADGILGFSVKEGDGEEWTTEKLDAPRYFVYWRQEPLVDLVRASGWQPITVSRAAGIQTDWLYLTCRAAG